MLVSELKLENLRRGIVNRLLFEGIADDGRNGDCIFVFGSTSSLVIRVPKAVEIYLAGRSGKILMSGGDRFGGKTVPEALAMKERAMELGVPERDILVETVSNHTKENVLASMLPLDRAFGLHRVKRLLVVTSLHHMRRSLLFLLTYLPPWIEYTLCPAPDPQANPENWWNNPVGIQRVCHEVEGLIRAVREGHIRDWEF